MLGHAPITVCTGNSVQAMICTTWCQGVGLAHSQHELYQAVLSIFRLCDSQLLLLITRSVVSILGAKNVRAMLMCTLH